MKKHYHVYLLVCCAKYLQFKILKYSLVHCFFWLLQCVFYVFSFLCCSCQSSGLSEQNITSTAIPNLEQMKLWEVLGGRGSTLRTICHHCPCSLLNRFSSIWDGRNQRSSRTRQKTRMLMLHEWQYFCFFFLYKKSLNTKTRGRSIKKMFKLYNRIKRRN